MTDSSDFTIGVVLVACLIAVLVWRVLRVMKYKRAVETGIITAHGIIEAKKIVESIRHCEICGYDNPSSDTYCGRCGAELKGGDRTHIY